MWLTAFPIDVVKTKIQADSFVLPTFRNAWVAAKRIWRYEGVKGFYKGIAPCMLRGAPANAATFGGFELAMRHLNKY